MTNHTEAELLRDIEEHMRKMWDERLLPANCWPTDLAKRLTEAVRRAPAAPVPQGFELVQKAFLREFRDKSKTYLLNTQAPAHYWNQEERDAYSDGYQQCGSEFAKLREYLAAAPKQPEAEAKVSQPHFEAAPVQIPALTDKQIEAAAKCIAESMDYPWHEMFESGRESMRKIAKEAIERANGIKGEIN